MNGLAREYATNAFRDASLDLPLTFKLMVFTVGLIVYTYEDVSSNQIFE